MVNNTNNKEQITTVLMFILCFGGTWAIMHFFLGEYIKAILELFSMEEQFKMWYWGSFIFISVSMFGIVSRAETARQAHEAIIRMSQKK